MSNRNAKPERGQSLLEFAITLPLILLLLVMLFDVGRATFYYSSITNAAREGARYGIINPDNSSGIRQTVRDFSFGINPAELDITVFLPPDTNTIRVTVIFNFVPATPLVAPFLQGNSGITFQTETTMQIEG